MSRRADKTAIGLKYINNVLTYLVYHRLNRKLTARARKLRLPSLRYSRDGTFPDSTGVGR